MPWSESWLIRLLIGMKIEKNKKEFFLAVGLLSGGIIGAGVFSLPYAFQLAGLLTGFFYLAIATGVYILLHMMYADVIIKTPGEHRFVGLARTHLGKGSGLFAVLMGVVQMIFVLTIYLVLSKSFLALIVSFGNSAQHIFFFWLIGSVAIFLNLRKIALSELLITLSIIAIIAVVFVLGLAHIPRLAEVPAFTESRFWLIPLPAILFALSGRVVIPAVIRFLRERGSGDDRRRLFRVILWGTVIPAIVYGLFVIGVLGLSANVTEDAVSGLAGGLPAWLVWGIGILGFLSLWSSYILVGLDVYETLRFDLGLRRPARLALVVLAPLLLYAAGFTSFLGLVSFVGGVFLVLEGFFVIAMYRKAHGLPGLFAGPHRLMTILATIALLGALGAVLSGAAS